MWEKILDIIYFLFHILNIFLFGYIVYVTCYMHKLSFKSTIEFILVQIYIIFAYNIINYIKSLDFFYSEYEEDDE